MRRELLRSGFCFATFAALAAPLSLAVPGPHFQISDYKGIPYQDNRHAGGAQTIPGRVMCAYYDRGGEGVTYHDSDAKNSGSGGLNPADGTYLNEFRMHDAVDTSYTKYHDQIDNNPYEKVHPQDGLLYVGWTEPGEWFNITVDVAHAGIYRGDLLYTSNPWWDDIAGCEWKRCNRSGDDPVDLQSGGPHYVAAVAPLEPCPEL